MNRLMIWHAIQYLTTCKLRGHRWRQMSNLHMVCTRCTALTEWDS